MKIVVRGAAFSNRGAEAMLRTVQCELLRRNPDVSIAATVPSNAAQLCRINGIHPVCDGLDSRVARVAGRRVGEDLAAFRLSFSSPELKGVARMSRRAALRISRVGTFDMVVDVSGFSYSDQCPWGLQEAIETRAWTSCCRERGIPYVFMPQAWGPFEEPQLRSLVQDMCGDASAVYSRDEMSTEYLRELLGNGSSDVRQGPDVAFLLPCPSADDAAAVLSGHGVRTSRPIVVVSPNMRVCEKAEVSGGGNGYIQLLIKLVRHLIKAQEVFVVLHPNEVFPDGSNGFDDRFVCGVVEAAINDPTHCVALDRRANPVETKAFLSCADMVISSRFHSLVFALGAGVPSIALGWSHKYVELMRDCGLSGNVIDWAADVAFDQVRDLVDDNWEKRQENRRILEAHLPKICKEAGAIFDHAASLLPSSGT